MLTPEDEAMYSARSNSSLWQRVTGILGRKGRFILISAVVIGIFVLLAVMSRSTSGDSPTDSDVVRYLLQKSYLKYEESSTEYKIAIVSDMDTASKVGEDKWKGKLKHGKLTRNPGTRKYSIKWTDEFEISSKYNEGGRGMELSELIYFNDMLLTCDDRTGIVYEIIKEKTVVPRYVLATGDGNKDKGFKCEWLTVKDNVLHVGSLGKEWTDNTGTILNYDPCWIKTIDRDGRIKHINWTDRYNYLREQTETEYPAYMVHEAVGWNPVDRSWLFLPRRFSQESYDEASDEERGSNKVIKVNEAFNKVTMSEAGEIIKTHGFSSFKYIPWRENEIVALKSEEYKGDIATYILVFDVTTGEVLMDEEKIPDSVKYEGVEFI
jgi:soluble calcium-activated nucleotidase 1